MSRGIGSNLQRIATVVKKQSLLPRNEYTYYSEMKPGTLGKLYRPEIDGNN